MVRASDVQQHFILQKESCNNSSTTVKIANRGEFDFFTSLYLANFIISLSKVKKKTFNIIRFTTICCCKCLAADNVSVGNATIPTETSIRIKKMIQHTRDAGTLSNTREPSLHDQLKDVRSSLFFQGIRSQI